MKQFTCKKCKKEFSSENALSMHNRDKHKFANKGMSIKDKRKIRNYVILSSVIILFVVSIYSWSSSFKDAPRIIINPSNHDFGTVSRLSDGVVSAVLLVTNDGNTDLEINNIKTSCGCTKVSLVINGSEGPKHGMSHDIVKPEFSEVVPPGESIELKVYYDPNVHKDLEGSVTRSVYVYSDDPLSPIAEVKINVYQVS